MEELLQLNELVSSELLQSSSAIVTAIATIVLAVLTWVLAKATRAMALATAQPHVVASLEANTWSLGHLDLVLENAGNAPAYDVKITFDPQLPIREGKGDAPAPFQNMSIVRPGQILVSYVGSFASYENKVFKVYSSWKRRPSDLKRETLEYTFDVRSLDGVSILGRRSPEVQIAEEIKHIRNDWKSIAAGTRRIKSDTFSQCDRDREKKDLREHWSDSRKANRAIDERPGDTSPGDGSDTSAAT